MKGWKFIVSTLNFKRKGNIFLCVLQVLFLSVFFITESIFAQSTEPDLAITKTHSGNFTQGQTGATYTITVSNDEDTPTNGTVTMTDTLPSGLTATAISGTGWACTLATLTCTRSDPLADGSYPPITLTVNVAINAPASVTNVAHVAGGEDIEADHTASDPTTINFSAGSITSVPTMTEWGMIAFVLLAGLSSVYYLRRQKRTGN